MFLNRGTAITVGLVMIICGAVFLFLPGFTMTMFAMALGAMFVVVGLIAVVGWWIKFRQTGTGGGILMLGIISIILGIVCLVHPLAFAESIGWIIAGSVVLSGVVQLIVILTAHDMFGKPVALISTGVSIALGVLALAMPELIVQFLGAALILDGITEVAYGIMSGRTKTHAEEQIVISVTQEAADEQLDADPAEPITVEAQVIDE